MDKEMEQFQNDLLESVRQMVWGLVQPEACQRSTDNRPVKLGSYQAVLVTLRDCAAGHKQLPR